MLSRIKIICAIAGLVLLTGRTSFAEHIIGGEMFYECTGPGQYSFTMKLFRDCFTTGADFDNPGHFAVFDQNNQLVEIIQTFVQSVQPVSTNVSSPCMILPPNICVEEGTYSFNLTVPNLNQSYTVVYQRCCRNATIQNLNNPGAQGLSIESVIPAHADVECNSSPFYNNFPPPVLCAQELLEFDHSATDPDGDSLAYSLCSPYIGGTQGNPMPVPASNPPYPPVLWGGTFDAENPLPGNPGLSIDPVTGFLTGVPTQLGQYVIGVCVEEWRDGQLLSVNTRDFQFNVAFCEPPSAADINIPDVVDLCQGLTVPFSSSSAATNTFLWDFGDEGSDNPTSNLINPVYTFSDTGTYVVTLITNAGFFCSDTASIVIPIFYSASINASYDGFICEGQERFYNFSASGVFDEGAPIIWNFGPNATPSTATGLTVAGVSFGNDDVQTIEVEVLNNACSAADVYELEIAPLVEVSIEPQTVFCNGYTYNFDQVSENASSFMWDFGVGNDGAVSLLASPSFTFPGDGIYNVTLTAVGTGNCPVTVDETFDIKSLLAPQAPDFPVQCFDSQSFNFEPEGSFSSSAVFSWTFDNAVQATSSQPVVANQIFLEPGTHAFSLTISENGCTRSADGEVTVHENPIADFDASPRTGCAPLSVSFQNLSETQSTNTAYTWDYGDGSPFGSFATTHVYNRPGTYTVTMNLQNLNGCIDSDEKVRQAFIEVLPRPTPGFAIDPQVVSAMEPLVTITDASEGSTSCFYFFDNQEFTACSFSHMLNDFRPQTITQRVSNEFGCTAELERNIRVADHLIYVPNAFSPNGDGVNDIFEPVITGAVSYDMVILDRWGKEVFLQRDVQRGWDGSYQNGSYYSQAGLYQYIIMVTDFSGWNFEYKGHVTLIR